MTRLITAWYWIRSSLWFFPCLMILSSFGLAWGFLTLDRHLSDQTLASLHGIYTGGSEGARELLSTVSGSAITVVGVIFSITIVALSQASSQFGPRLLRNFMRDTGNQLVMGAFIGTFVYCLLILRTIRSGEDRGSVFVPQLSISFGVVLALVCIVFLVYFIHHVSASIQVDDVIAKVVRDIRKSVGTHPMEKVGEPWAPDGDGKGLPEGEGGTWSSARGGYLQSLDGDALFQFACKHDLTLEILCHPGDFIQPGRVHLRFWPQRDLSPSQGKQLTRCFILGAHRTPLQDFGYGVNLLVEITLRGLSPSINDPFTALMCIDRLEELLVPLADMPPPCPNRADGKGNLRIVDHPLAFADTLKMALDPIRLFGAANPAMVLRVLGLLTRAASRCGVAQNRPALAVHAKAYAREEGWSTPMDREAVAEAYAAFLHANSTRELSEGIRENSGRG